MKRLLMLMLFATGASYAQSPFDGTWIIQSDPAQFSQKPVEYMLVKGTFRCTGCIVNIDINADGRDRKIAQTSYWDTASVRILDEHSAEITLKKSGKTMFTEIDTVSKDGATLTQLLNDTTGTQTVTTATLFRRIEQGPASGHAISGSWRAYKMTISKNGTTIKYNCTADGFSAETPLGEKFNAKFDGEDYPVIDDPGHTMISVKRMGPTEVEVTSKRNGKVVGILHLTAEAERQIIHVVFEDKENNVTKTYQMSRVP